MDGVVSSETLTRLLDTDGGAVYRAKRGPPRRMVSLSDGIQTLTGYEPETLVSDARSWHRNVVHPEDRSALETALEAVFERECAGASDSDDFFEHTYRIRTATDERRWVRDRGRVCLENDQLAGYLRDVTAEREHEDAAAQLEYVFDELPIHLFVKDTAARHVRVGTGLHDHADEFLGKTDLELGLEGISEGHARAGYEDDMHVLTTGESILNKHERLPKFGRHYLTSKVPWEDGEHCRGLVGVTIDITDQKLRQQQLERENERLEQFASVLSHDLRNPLAVAQGYLEVARADEDSQALREIHYGLERIEELIEDVLTLARHGADTIDQQPVALESAVRRAWELVETDDATLQADSLATISADYSRLRQLLANVFRNAVEHATVPAANGESRSPTVRVGMLEEGFFIEDDGPGFPDEADETLFEPGFSTGETGTGFGLAIVEDIATVHGWTIETKTGRAGGARLEVTSVTIQ